MKPLKPYQALLAWTGMVCIALPAACWLRLAARYGADSPKVYNFFWFPPFHGYFPEASHYGKFAAIIATIWTSGMWLIAFIRFISVFFQPACELTQPIDAPEGVGQAPIIDWLGNPIEKTDAPAVAPSVLPSRRPGCLSGDFMAVLALFGASLLGPEYGGMLISLPYQIWSEGMQIFGYSDSILFLLAMFVPVMGIVIACRKRSGDPLAGQLGTVAMSGFAGGLIWAIMTPTF